MMWNLLCLTEEMSEFFFFFLWQKTKSLSSSQEIQWEDIVVRNFKRRAHVRIKATQFIKLICSKNHTFYPLQSPKYVGTHFLIPVPGPALFHERHAQWSCCWLCAGSSSHLTGDQPTTRTGSAQSHTRPTGAEWWLWIEKEKQITNKGFKSVCLG